MNETDKNAYLDDLSRRKLTLLGVPRERRRDRRCRLTVPLPAHLGSVQGVLIDISARGARLHHRKPVKLGVEVRLAFEWPDGPFLALARILSSRLIVAGVEKPEFESRLQFLEVSPQSRKLLERVMNVLTDAQLRRWVENFMGELVYPRESGGDRGERLRFRLVNGRWSAGPALAEETPPPDGFIVPASIEPGEINVLCATYGQLDRDGQQLLRLCASLAVAA